MLFAQALNVSCDALLYREKATSCMENINRLLADRPIEYLSAIEKLIRTCIEEFEPKENIQTDL